jgi:hypothetical protein
MLVRLPIDDIISVLIVPSPNRFSRSPKFFVRLREGLPDRFSANSKRQALWGAYWQKRWRSRLPRADTVHVGWKTGPVRDDREKGHGISVASRDGLATWWPRAKDGPIGCAIRPPQCFLLGEQYVGSLNGSISRTESTRSSRPGHRIRPSLHAMNGLQGAAAWK